MTKQKNVEEGPDVTGTCTECKILFTYKDPRQGKPGRFRTLCPACKDAKDRAVKLRYRFSTEGRETQKRYQATEAGKRVYADAQIKYRREHPDKIAAYRSSEKGREVVRNNESRNNARRRSQDPESYAQRVFAMRKDREPCDWCGRPYERCHQVDHAMPLALGIFLGMTGLDDWSNLHVLCRSCHDGKSRRDKGDTVRLKHLLK